MLFLIIALYIVFGCITSAVFDVICRLEDEEIDLFLAFLSVLVWPVWLFAIGVFALSKLFARMIWRAIERFSEPEEDV